MNVLSIIFVTILLAVIATGILLLLILTERNLLQKTLVVILIVFSVTIFGGLVNMINQHGSGSVALSQPLSFRSLALGFVAFFTTMCYYVIAAHRNMFTTRNSLIFMSPVILTLVFYVIWHLVMKIPMGYEYDSLTEIWENRHSMTVILRLLMYLFFLLYQGVMYVDMWQLDSLRERHSILNLPDSVGNIRWLRMVVVGMISITICYSLLLFLPSPPVVLLYVMVSGAVFVFFINNAIARRMYTDTEECQLTWSVRGGWKYMGRLPETETQDSLFVHGFKQRREVASDHREILLVLDEWMEAEKPYCRPEFSPSDITASFKNLDYAAFTIFFKERGENIQSYIRRLRVEEACRLIREENLFKVGELAERVGFTQHTSFSRAFSAVTNQSPLQYIRSLKEELNGKEEK